MMLKSDLCSYSDAYILVKGTITVRNTAAIGIAGWPNDKKILVFKKCTPVTNCINNTQVGNTKDIDVVMTMYNLIDSYSKTSGSLRQY